MAMEFWLSWQNRAESMRLPVLPSSFEMKTANTNTRVNINELGTINLIGKSDLKEIAIESFFPTWPRGYNHHYCDISWYPSNPYDAVKQIERWRKSGKPIRFIITDTNINIAAAIESFTYGERDGSGDVYFSLELSEYIFPHVKLKNDEGGYSLSGERPILKEIPQRYVVKPGDTLGSIAKKLTGDWENYKIIAERNSIKDPNVIEEYQTLMIF